MKVYITTGSVRAVTDEELKQIVTYEAYEYTRVNHLYEVEEGDIIAVTFDNNRRVCESAVNPSGKRVALMQKNCRSISELYAGEIATHYGDSADNWRQYLNDGYPLLWQLKVVSDRLETIDKKNL